MYEIRASERPASNAELSQASRSRIEANISLVRGTAAALPGGATVALARSLHVAVLVRRHLTEPQHRVLALDAVVVGLLPVVAAALQLAALAGRELLEAGLRDRVELCMLPPVSHHLVGVRAHELALEAVEVRRLVLALVCEGEAWCQLVLITNGPQKYL